MHARQFGARTFETNPGIWRTLTYDVVPVCFALYAICKLLIAVLSYQSRYSIVVSTARCGQLVPSRPMFDSWYRHCLILQILLFHMVDSTSRVLLIS
jgi:hypothetical protein